MLIKQGTHSFMYESIQSNGSTLEIRNHVPYKVEVGWFEETKTALRKEKNKYLGGTLKGYEQFHLIDLAFDLEIVVELNKTDHRAYTIDGIVEITKATHTGGTSQNVAESVSVLWNFP